MEKKTPPPRYLTMLVVISLLVIPLLTVLPSNTRGTAETKTIGENDKTRYTLYGDSNDEFLVTFTVTHGSEADIYIMTSFEYNEHYEKDQGFNVSFFRENTKSVPETKWKQPDDQRYYLVVDNTNRSRNGSEGSGADPTGSITYTIDYKNKTKEDEIEDFFEMFRNASLICTVGCCAVIILIIVVIILLIRKKQPTPMMGPPGAPPYQAPYQPPYQPPYRPPSQPPGY